MVVCVLISSALSSCQYDKSYCLLMTFRLVENENLFQHASFENGKGDHM